MFSIDTILNPPTEEEWLEENKAFLDANGLSTTSWKEGDPELTVLMLITRKNYLHGLRAKAVLEGTLNDTASGEALTRLSDSHFDNQRTDAVRTVGDIIVTLSSSIAPGYQCGEFQGSCRLS
jgi:hypothetical protein